jgi:hypothetical protein
MDLDVRTGNKMLRGEPHRACICCGHPLLSTSKMNRASIAKTEAVTKQWLGQENSDGAVEVDMCLQCQIDRAAASKPLR